MRKINIYLNLLMFIGVGVTLLHFFSTPVNALTYEGHYQAQEVIDVWEPISFSSSGSPTQFMKKSHFEITVTTNSDNAYGEYIIPNTSITFYYSGKETILSYPGPQGTYTSYTPLSYVGSFTPTVIEGIEFIDLNVDTIQESTNLTSWSNTATGPIDPNKYYKIGTYNFNEMYDSIFCLEVPVGLNTEGKTFKMYQLYDDNRAVEIPLSLYFITYTRFSMKIYFIIDNIRRYVPINQFRLIMQFEDGYIYPNRNYSFTYLPYADDHYFELYKFIQDQGKSQTVDDVDLSNSDFSSSSQQMMQLEDQLQGDFNSAIGNITVPSNPFGDMGVMFGNTSRFLVHMFDQMTISNNSPFGTVITFSLILGLALLMIGKKGSR